MDNIKKLSLEEIMQEHEKSEARKAYMRACVARYRVEKMAQKYEVTVKEYLSPEFQKRQHVKNPMTWEQYVEATNKVVHSVRGRKAREAKGITGILVL
jgi:hypothetical protein